MKKIAIFGVPRSGTSWLSQIFNSHPDVVMRFQPLFSFGHKGKLTIDSTGDEINRFYDEILRSQDPFALMNAEMHKSYPVLEKSTMPTHIAFKETRYLYIIENIIKKSPETKIIGIVRNPLATLASWILAPKEFNQEWDVHREWRTAPSKNLNKKEEYYGFDKWKEIAEVFLRFQSQLPQQFLLLSYNELNRSPLDTTKKIFYFCGLEVCHQVEKFLVESKSRHDPDPYSVYHSNANDNRWQGILPDKIAKKIIVELKNSPLDIYLQGGTNA